MILCVTLDQPACWHLVRQERPLVPVDSAAVQVGDFLALHASCIVDLGESSRLREEGVEVPPIPDLPLLAFVAIGRVESVSEQGAVLAELRQLATPIPHRGGVGTWRPDGALIEQLRAAWKGAT